MDICSDSEDQLFVLSEAGWEAPGYGSGEVRQLCVQSLVAYLLGPSCTKFKKGVSGVFNIEFR